MSQKLIAFIITVLFSAFCCAQEKIVLKPTYPAGKFLYKLERQTVDYESFYRPFFDFRSNTPRKLKMEMEMISRNAPPNENGFVRTDVEVTKYLEEESPEKKELSSEESRQKLQWKNERDKFRRIVQETPTWMLTDPKTQRILEVHGYNQGYEKLYELAETLFYKEFYRWAKLHSGDEATKELRESKFRFFPKNPISPGDQWKHSHIELLPILGKVELEFTNTLKEIKINQAGKQIAVIKSQSEWKTDDPTNFGQWDIEYLQVETSFDFVSEWEVETGMEIFQEKQIKVVAKRQIHYDDGPYLVAFVAEQIEKTTGERMEE